MSNVMLVADAVELVYSEAQRHGQPLSRDVCTAIVARLFDIPGELPPPGDVARYHRNRYDDNDGRGEH